jgi:acetyltransferase
MSRPLPFEWSGPGVASTSPRANRFRIRELCETDLAACQRFFYSLAGNDVRARFASSEFAVEYFLPRRIAGGEHAGFAAFDDTGLTLGVVNLCFLSAASAEIAIVVRSDQKRRGIGRALVTHALRWAAGHGRLEVIGLISTDNRSALLFARALGFGVVRWDRYHHEVMRDVS